MPIINKNQPLLFFDGVCVLCNSSVKRLMKWDKKKKLHFAPLHGETWKHYNIHEQTPPNTDSILFFDGEKVYYESDAIFKIIEYLGGIWKIFLLFKILPSTFLNRMYRWVAKNRYKTFGQQETCFIPETEDRERFLE